MGTSGLFCSLWRLRAVYGVVGWYGAILFSRFGECSGLLIEVM